MLHIPRPLLDASMSTNLSTTEVRSTVCEDTAASTSRLPEKSYLHKTNCNWQACRASDEGNQRTEIDIRSKGLLKDLSILTFFNFSSLPGHHGTVHHLQETHRPWTSNRLLQKSCSRPKSKLNNHDNSDIQLTQHLCFRSQVVCKQRIVVEPKEICQTIVCQPKPQTIQIPEPREFMCAPTGTAYMNRPGCPPVPVLPLGKPYNPCPPQQFNCWQK